MYKKILCSLLILVLVFILVGCESNLTQVPKIDDEVIVTDGLKVSFIARNNPRATAQVRNREHYDFNREIYAEPFKSGKEGKLVRTFSPSSMIVQIFKLSVANQDYNMPLVFIPSVLRGEHQSWGIPPTFDLVYSDKVIDASYIIEKGRYDFQAVHITFFTVHEDKEISGRDVALNPQAYIQATGNSGINEQFPAVSEIHVDLGEDYKNVVFEKALYKYGTTHVFQMVDLIPLSKEGGEVSTTSILFDANVTTPFILNPDGEYVSDLNPFFWDSDTRWGRPGYVIYRPGFDLDFSGSGKHLIFEWDLNGLIEVYDNNTEDYPDDDIVTLRLDDPFPIKLRVEDLKVEEPEIVDTTLEEVNHLNIRYYDLMEKQILLRWTNPGIENFEMVRIVKKMGAAPEDEDDGEIVYEGVYPIFEDYDVERFNNYYYRVIVVGRDGRMTKGKVINIETIPPKVNEIEVSQDDVRIKEVEVKVGEEIRLEAIGRNENGSVNIAPDWELENTDIGELKQSKGEYTTFIATEVGEGILVVSLDEDFGSPVTEIKIRVIE